MCSILSKATVPVDFIKPNIIKKLANKVKYIGQINGGLIMFFFQEFKNKIFLKYLAQLWTIKNQWKNWKINTKITYMWRRCDTPQNYFLAFIDKLEKQIIIKKTAEVGQ